MFSNIVAQKKSECFWTRICISDEIGYGPKCEVWFLVNKYTRRIGLGGQVCH